MTSRNLYWITMVLCGTAIWVITGCRGMPSLGPQAGSVQDHASFVAALRAKGLTVESLGSIDQPFLQPEGTGLRVSGGDLKEPAELQSFEYDDRALGTDGLKAAADDANQIEPNGDPRTMRIQWVAPPHFFRKGRIIVLYLGSDANLLALLQELLGPPFASR